MKEVFIKKYWDEEEVLFYIHFREGRAVRQIEVSSSGRRFLSLDNPVKNESMLYDQNIAGLDLKEEDYITKLEFEEAWAAK